MSPWLLQLREASFRGVPFRVDDARVSGGRRAVVTEFPLRDEPQVDDLGRRASEYSVQAYILGPDYMPARDALIEALNRAGPGDLVHPWLGDLRVQVGDFDFTETVGRGGYVEFSIRFHEASPVVYPRPRPDTQATLANALAGAQLAAQESFAEIFSVQGFPEFVTEAAAEQLGGAIEQIRAITARVPTVPGELTELVGLADDLSRAAGALAARPLELARDLGALLDQLQVAASRPLATLEALGPLFGFGQAFDDVPGTTPSRQQQAINQAALVQLVRQSAVLAAAGLASAADYPSLEDATSTRDRLLEQLDALVESDIDDSLYQALGQVRADLAEDLRRRGTDLARLVRVQLLQSTPSLALAWRLYGDAARAPELVDRNRVENPMFMPAGRPLEALSE